MGLLVEPVGLKQPVPVVGLLPRQPLRIPPLLRRVVALHQQGKQRIDVGQTQAEWPAKEGAIAMPLRGIQAPRLSAGCVTGLCAGSADL
ncbi:hypothetical protein JCM17961_15690 [Endothiovibrio diazotrophicus]